MSTYVLHCFRPSETIEAVLRLKGRHNYTRQDLQTLMRQFDALNGPVIVRPGMTLKIPLLDPPAESEGGETD